MKRFLCILSILAVLVCLFSCNEKSTYENILSQLDKYEFDAVTPYDKENIAQIQKNLELNSLPTDVTNICHYFTRSLLAGKKTFGFTFMNLSLMQVLKNLKKSMQIIGILQE